MTLFGSISGSRYGAEHLVDGTIGYVGAVVLAQIRAVLADLLDIA